jgi:LmbE family N-acetylglucosaminyl deacetylase
MTGTPLTRRTLLTGAAAVAASTILTGEAAAAVPPALFIAAHPDDETLAMGVAIAEHVAAGIDTHVLILTDGRTSGARAALNGEYVSSWWRVRHDPAAEGYTPLDPATFGQHRLNEADRAVACLATGLGPVTIHHAGLPADAVGPWAAVDAIRKVADAINPGGPVWLKTHSPKVDNHRDHLAAGGAVAWLAGTGDPARFNTPRYYILPAYWADTRLSTVAESWDYPTNVGIRDRVVNACRVYGAWAPPHSYAIGQHSSPALFARIAAAPKCLIHP